MRACAVRARAWVSGNKRAGPATAAALLLAAGCGGSPEPVAEAMPYLDPGFVEAGDYRLHYALTLASDLLRRLLCPASTPNECVNNRIRHQAISTATS